MSDRLYLSCWMRGYTGANMLRHFERVLALFPFSKLAARGPEVRVYAIEHAEPAQIERELPPSADVHSMIHAAGEFMHPDCLCEVDAAWDLLQPNEDWKLAPAAVVLSCYGPEFDNELGDHVRIDFGQDAHYLPGTRMGQANLKSLVHLVHEIERAAGLERRRLWSESGESPADVIAEAVQ